MSKTQIRKTKKKRVEIWATQIETNRLRTTSKNPTRNLERGRNPRPKHKPKMQKMPETQPKIHAETQTQTQTPKPIPKHKHSPKSTLKYKHKCRNPYWNRNTNVEMGQRWRLGAWGLGRRRIEEERWLELGWGKTYPDWRVWRNHQGAAGTRVTRRRRKARQWLWTAWILSLRRI